MSIPDLGMSGFLTVMAGMNAWNCFTLYRSKEVKGISPTTVLFRSSANVWQAWFFYTMHQWFAFSAAVPATGLNILWVGMAFWYGLRNRRSHDC